MTRLLPFLMVVVAVIATMLIIKGVMVFKTRKVRRYHEMLVRTAEGEHETELLPHADPNVAKVCPVCEPARRVLKSTHEPNMLKEVRQSNDYKTSIESLQERIETSLNNNLGVTVLPEGMHVGYSDGNAIIFDRAMDAFRAYSVPDAILEYRECDSMGWCSSPRCHKVCTPEPVKIPVGVHRLNNETYVYDPSLGLLREKRPIEEDVVNLREKEESTHNAVNAHPLFPMTPNERREVQGLTDYDFAVLDEKRKLYLELRKLDQRGDLTPDERDREERRLLALRHDL